MHFPDWLNPWAKKDESKKEYPDPNEPYEDPYASLSLNEDLSKLIEKTGTATKEITETPETISFTATVTIGPQDHSGKKEMRVVSPPHTWIFLIPTNELILGDLSDKLDDICPIPHVRCDRFHPETWIQIGQRPKFAYSGEEEWIWKTDEQGHPKVPARLEGYLQASD